MDPLTYTATRPKKRMAAGALFFDDHNRFMLVEPTYKDDWEIPGGVVEANESPLEACMREVHEELGVSCCSLRILSVDWTPARDDHTEGILFIFDGGHLTPEQIGAIQTPDDELHGYRFSTLDEARYLVSDEMWRRLAASLCASYAGKTVYLEDGYPIGA